MKKKIEHKLVKYKDDFDGVDAKDLEIVPREKLARIIPSPTEVAESLKKARITILLDADTVREFRDEAKRHKVSYQKMIRYVLREYIARVKRAA